MAGKYVTGEERKQEVAQLANAIVSLAAGSRVPAQLVLDQVNLVIPVLLVRDPLMEAPLHSRYLADEFVKAVAPEVPPSTGNIKKGALLDYD